ncbi:MAG TPA: hypothetical protein DEH78_21325, partial [Solibacterales bacterium]|nr:hypothetical protein [Bryobacterales bacterium]
MSLATKLASKFPHTTQARGFDLFFRGAVRPVRSTPTSFEAEVLGGELSSVDLRLNGKALEIECDCDAFLDRGPCKHIWAAILEADRRGALEKARHVSPLTLVDALDGAGAEPSAPASASLWREQLRSIALYSRDHAQPGARTAAWPAGFQVAYAIDLPASRSAGAPVVTLLSRSRKKNGDWTVFKDLHLTRAAIFTLPDPADTEILEALAGAPNPLDFSSHRELQRFALPAHLALKVLPVVSAAGRLWAAPDYHSHQLRPIAWDSGEPWRFCVRVHRNERDLWEITGEFRRGADERAALDAPEFIFASGFLLLGQTLARFQDTDALPWVRQLLNDRTITFMDRDRDAALAALLESPVVPPLDLAPELDFEQRQGSPRFGVRLNQAKNAWGDAAFNATLLADYGAGLRPLRREESRGFWMPGDRLYVLRDQQAEAAAWQTLSEGGVRLSPDGGSPGRLLPKAMPKLVRHLIAEGWRVEAEGRAFRSPGATRLEVTSGIDWFELHGQIDYEGQTAALPDLLAALRRGDAMVKLDDGSFGMLPEEWLARFAPLAGLGEVAEGHLRFRSTQAGLLDALLAA